MKKMILSALVFLTISSSSPALALSEEGYVGLLLNQDGSISSVSVGGEVSELDAASDDHDSNIVLNHLGEVAFVSEPDIFEGSNIALASIASSNSVELVWRSVLPLNGDLYRDGEFVSKLQNQSSYFDDGLEPGSIHHYQLSIRNELIENLTVSLEPIGFDIVGTTVQLASQKDFTAIATLAMVSQPTYSILRYATFIKDKYVGTPVVGCSPFGTHFLGNNRNFNPYATAQDSKTILTLRVDWNSLSAEYWAYVGPTVMVSMNSATGLYEETFRLQASNENLWVSLRRPILSTSAEFNFYVDAANPACLGLPIKVDLDILIKRTGAYFIAGAVRFVPNHEFYLYQDNTDVWSTIYRKSISPVGFSCFNQFSFDAYSSKCIDNVKMTTGGVVTYG
jgi:hypothetical protein